MFVSVALRGFPLRGARLDDAHDVALLHDDELFALDLDLGAGPFAEEHPIARLDVERMCLAILAARSGSDGDAFALHRLFLDGVRDDDPTRRLLLLLDASDQHAILQRSEAHLT